MPVSGDWDGDGKDSLGVFRPSNGTWHLSNSTTSPSSDAAAGTQWGQAGDYGNCGDWNGDGKDTIGVYRPSTGTWYLSTTNRRLQRKCRVMRVGGFDHAPGTGDWNNDGKDDIALYGTNGIVVHAVHAPKTPGDTGT